MLEGTEDYVSVIGTSYLYPIASLLDALYKFQPKGPNEVQASSPENGYSVAIIILTVLMIESFVNRAKYLYSVTAKRRELYRFVQSRYPDSGWGEKIKELSALRDIIAHNHLWEARYGWSEEIDMKLLESKKLMGYGDSKFDEVAESGSRLTRLLRLNIFPTRISFSDVKVVLKTAVGFLLFLEEQDHRILHFSLERVRYQGKLRMFVDVVNGL